MNKEGKYNILIAHNYYQTRGGEDSVVLNEKKMLEDNGHKVVLYTRNNDEIKNYSILKKIKSGFEAIYSFKTKKEIKKIIKEEKIDIVHIHNTLPLISPSIYKSAKESGAKVVQTIHNFRLLCPGGTFYRNNHICEDCVSKGLYCSIKYKCYRNSRIQTLFYVIMFKLNRIVGSYKFIDAYIALTDFSKKKLSTLIPTEKIFIKPNFTGKPNISLVPIEERKYFVFLGRLDKVKGINLLMEIWKSIKDEDLLVVGTGPEEKWCNDFISNNKINNIHMIGFKEKDEVMKILSKAKALIVPSQCYETFGLVAIEAFSMGVPVIGSNIGALESIISDGINGYKFMYDEAYDLKKKILKMILDKEINIDNIIKEYNNKYAQEDNYTKLMHVYNSI